MPLPKIPLRKIFAIAAAGAASGLIMAGTEAIAGAEILGGGLIGAIGAGAVNVVGVALAGTVSKKVYAAIMNG
jgi:hypothetical protein